MREFLEKYGLRLLIITTVCAVLISVLSFVSATSGFLQNAVGVLTYPFRSAVTAVATWAEDKQRYYKDYSDLIAENEALRERVAELERDARQAEARPRGERPAARAFGAARAAARPCVRVRGGHRPREHELDERADAQPRHGARRGEKRLRGVRRGRPGGRGVRGGLQLVHRADGDRHRHGAGRAGVPHAGGHGSRMAIWR